MATTADGSKTAKLFLGIAAGVIGLSVLCCVGGWFLIPAEKRNLIGEGISMARQMAAGIKAIDEGFAADFGEDGRWELTGANEEGLLLIGVGPGTELDEATVSELQDRAWRRYANAFAAGGMPLGGVGIGRAGERQGASSYQGSVSGWTKNVVDVATLVERTGVAAPPASHFFESLQELDESDGVRVDFDVDEDAPMDDGE